MYIDVKIYEKRKEKKNLFASARGPRQDNDPGDHVAALRYYYTYIVYSIRM
jgi:hypothetical protein